MMGMPRIGVKGFGDFLWVSTSAGSGSAAKITALVLLCSVLCLLLDSISCSHSSLMSRCPCHIRLVRVLGLVRDISDQCSRLAKEMGKRL